jgi:MarR family transcriptional regulator, organic hydroperoxide resistance regulator
MTIPSTLRPTSPAAEAWTLMQDLFAARRGHFFAVIREFELSPPQFMALRRLEPDRPMPMSELAGLMACDNSNVTGIVDRLEDRGLVERRPAPHDRRVKMLAVTDAGAELRDRLMERLDDDPPEGLTALPAADQRTLRDLLRRALAS